MNNGKICLLAALSLTAATVFAAQEQQRVIRVQNSVRVGYDDNVYSTSDKTGSGFITDIVNISGKLTFSSRTDMLLYWQPEFRYRFDADPEWISYQDLYARFNHALSQRTFLQISDRFRYQDKEAQAGVGVSASNQNYLENDLMGALDYTINNVSQANLGAGYELRRWDDSNYGSVLGNDYDQLSAHGSYIRQLRPNTTQGILGLNYTDHEYEGDRGGFDSTTVYGGLDQNFNPDLLGNIRLGYTLSNIEDVNGSENKSSAPYLQAGLELNPSARTSLTGSLGYSLYQSQNSVYNAQDQFKFGLGARHDLSSKVSLSAALSYTLSLYDADYSKDTTVVIPDAKDNYVTFSIRGSYQINRNNFVDAGYTYSDRWVDIGSAADWNRNMVDIGWRLRL